MVNERDREGCFLVKDRDLDFCGRLSLGKEWERDRDWCFLVKDRDLDRGSLFLGKERDRDRERFFLVKDRDRERFFFAKDWEQADLLVNDVDRDGERFFLDNDGDLERFFVFKERDLERIFAPFGRRDDERGCRGVSDFEDARRGVFVCGFWIAVDRGFSSVMVSFELKPSSLFAILPFFVIISLSFTVSSAFFTTAAASN